ncbi:MAG: phosphoglycerate dehydrogenase [Clostridia bacterium]|nr:phosphoglycerate dehydrogenase [Clostridia bacterium]
MMNICTLNKIAACGTDRLAGYTITDQMADAAGVMVRSAAMHDMDLPDTLLGIARAGAGVNNIPIDKCSEQGIVVFNTPGANANAVKELVLAGLFLASRDVVGGIAWAQGLKGEGDAVGKLVEKGKSAFTGPELLGKKLGVIGLGAIGVLVANAAVALGMDVYGYDPYLSVDAAWKLSRHIHHAATLDEIYADCDYITVHVPLVADTKGMLNEAAFAAMKEGVRILNFSRAGLVDSDAMLAALEAGKVAAYVVDFPTDEMLGVKNVVAIPHLGASTPESEDNCAVMAANQLKAYLEDGNIINSVNFPDVNVPRVGDVRVCVLHKNIPNMLAQISSVVSACGVNIEAMTNKARKDLAYTVLDIAGAVADDVTEKIAAIDGIIRVRVL